MLMVLFVSLFQLDRLPLHPLYVFMSHFQAHAQTLLAGVRVPLNLIPPADIQKSLA